MNDPLLAAIDTARRGGNPMQLLERTLGQDPRMAQAMGMLRGKNARQLEQMARNMAKERGIDLNDLARSMGLM